MNNHFKQVMSRNSDKELHDIISNKSSYVVEAYIAAIEELQLRNLASEELIKTKDDLIENLIESERKKKAEFEIRKIKDKAERKKARQNILELLKPSKRYFYTPILLYLNISIFLIMILSGVHAFQPEAESLFEWGGNLRAATLNGQYWRLLSSMFLHAGLFHLLFNMYVLLYVGHLLEMEFGKNRFFLVYIVTGILASITSIIIKDNVVSVGASGAIFGLFGLLIALLVSNNYNIPKEARENLIISVSLFIGHSIIYGLRAEGIDNAAHVGGLLSGFIVGLIYYPTFKTPRYSRVISFGIVVFTFFLILSTPRIISNPHGEFHKVMTEFVNNENKALWMYRENIHESPEKTQHYLEKLNREGIEIWENNLELLNSLTGMPPHLNERIETLKQYSNLRRESCELMQILITENNSSAEERLFEVHNKIEIIISGLKAEKNKNNR